jgi:hypothetical protein
MQRQQLRYLRSLARRLTRYDRPHPDRHCYRGKAGKTLSELKRLKTLTLPARHQLLVNDLHPDSLSRILLSTYERQPGDFEQLLGLSGVGAKTLRALSLISELVCGVVPSYRDPVDRKTYDRSIKLLSRAIQKAKLGLSEKNKALKRLNLTSLKE